MVMMDRSAAVVDARYSALRRLWDEGMTASNIAKELKYQDAKTVIRTANKLKLAPRGQHWTAEQGDLFTAMRRRGCSAAEIGAAIGKTACAVQDRMNRERTRELAAKARNDLIGMSRRCPCCSRIFVVASIEEIDEGRCSACRSAGRREPANDRSECGNSSAMCIGG